MQHQNKQRMIMEVETLTKQELSSIKGGRWVYLEGEWYWAEKLLKRVGTHLIQKTSWKIIYLP